MIAIYAAVSLGSLLIIVGILIAALEMFVLKKAYDNTRPRATIDEMRFSARPLIIGLKTPYVGIVFVALGAFLLVSSVVAERFSN
jgi:hypothetical protein